MGFAGGMRLLHFSPVVLLVISLFQIWVFCQSVQVGAIRVFPENAVPKVKVSHGGVKLENADLFRKFFNGRTRTFGPTNTTQKGFDETKRRVPSCPDPLHN